MTGNLEFKHMQDLPVKSGKKWAISLLLLSLLLVSSVGIIDSPSFVTASATSLSNPSPQIHIITQFRIGDAPAFEVYNPSNKFVYVINSNTDYNQEKNQTVSIINSSSNAIIKTVKIGKGQSCCNPENIVYAPSGKEVFVINHANLPSDGVSIIKGMKRVATLYMTGPSGLAYDPSDQYVYLGANNGVYVIDPITNKVIGIVSVSNVSYYGSFGYDPANQEMYVTAWGGNVNYMVIVVIKVLDVVSVIRMPLNYEIGIINAYDPANKMMYVIYSYNPNGVYYSGVFLINSSTNKITAKIKVAYYQSSIESIAYNPANRNMYVIDTANPHGKQLGNLTMISSKTNNVKVVIQNSPDVDCVQMTFDPLNKDLYIPTGGYPIYILNAHNNVTTIQYMGGADGAIYNPSNNDVYIVNDYTDGYVTVVSS